MVVSVMGNFGFVLFALGLHFVDVSIAAILYETWPLILMLLMYRLFLDKDKDRDSQRYRPISPPTMIFLAVAIAGVALVILSHSETPSLLQSGWRDFANPETLLGVFLVIMAGACAAANSACLLKAGALLARAHTHAESLETREIVFAAIMTCIAQVIAAVTLCAVGVIAAETISLRQLLYASLGGCFVISIGIVAFRVANLKTDDLGVNAIAFATPLIALVLLWMFSSLETPHLDYLIVGAMGIVAANLLINAEADKRHAYKALVVSLWAFGTFVYFHEGYVTDVPLELPVTVFILVLAFRADRLVRRTSQEEGWVFEAFSKLEFLISKKQIDHDALKQLLKIDRHETKDGLSDAYEKLAGYLANPLKFARMDASTEERIMDIRHLVNNLAHSRQQGSHFGELVAIALAGGLIVVGLLVFNGERGFYGEFTSFLLSSVVVFLFVNILDLQNDRKDQILELKKKAGPYVVKFDDVANREGQQWISVVTSIVIVVVFAWLFTGS